MSPSLMNFIWFGAMDVTTSYEFIGFVAMDVTKPYAFIRFGAMDVTKPYEFIARVRKERKVWGYGCHQTL